MGFIKYRSGPDAEWQEIQGIKGDKGDTPVKGVDYYTEAEKNELIQEIQNSVVDGEVNLANYYTKTETDAAIAAAITPDLSVYYTKTEADTIIEEALTDYALKTDIPTTTGLATEDYVKGYVDGAIEDIPGTDLSNYYNKTQVNELVKTAKPDLTEYATKDDVATAIEGIEAGIVDLSNYYTKEETYTKAEVDAAIADIDVGEVEVDLSNYYTKTQTDAAITNKLSNYYTKTETATTISNQLANYYTKTQTANAIKAVYTYDETTGRLDINV